MDTFPLTANELILRLKGWWSQNYWLMVTPPPLPMKERES